MKDIKFMKELTFFGIFTLITVFSERAYNTAH